MRFRALIRNDCAAAAAETALALPILLALMFGPLELGNYFMSEHKVVKAVRDGARFAARQPFSPDYDGCAPSSDLVTETQNVTRTGSIDGTGTARLSTWTDPASITVEAFCNGGGAYAGTYSATTLDAPIVRVEASVPYTPVLGQLGLTTTTLTLHARSEAAVTGI